MNIYDQLGIRPFINAGGWMYTRYGGSIMPPPVVAAMAEASRQFVNLYELQDRVGEAIAAMTRNESAFVSCGAASGILLATAACIAGTDAELADRLPDTQGMRNQVIMQRCDRGTEADTAIRAAGGKIVDIGTAQRRPSADEVLGAISEQTAAILLVAFESERELDVGPIIKGARERKIPVLVDGASALPPRENLWHYTRDLGVDAFITSGGKGIRGPQSTGLVLGKRRIIEGCKYHASPNLRLGRGMKVGKEEFAGIYAALTLFLAEDSGAQAALKEKQIACIADHLKDIPGLKLSIADDAQLDIDIDPAVLAKTAEEAAKELLAGDPSILLCGRGDRITIRATLLQPGEEQLVGERLREVLIAGAKNG
jgi:D-glucosaminate-6-phosphate ammonia-lyase